MPRPSRPVSIRGAIAQSGLVPIDAHALLGSVLSRDRAWLVAHADDPLSPDEASAFFLLARRRRQGEPVAYLTGVREFWGLPLRVTPAVLIPRPETETLVEVALAHLPADGDTRVLDVGCGSGAVALAIGRERPRATVVATDISEEALAVAQDNARRLGIANASFLHSDWYADLPPGCTRFDVIVSNPPYVDPSDPHLERGDVRHEPRLALTAGPDALLALRRVITEGGPRLNPSGCLAVEHGYDQADAVHAMFLDAGYVDVRDARDLSGIPRVTFGTTR